jgi:hypothetical protein
MADGRYLVIKRPLRGIVAWLENPAYRTEVGDYVVTSEGKLVGLMVTRERCLLLTRENITGCGTAIPLADKSGFQRAVRQVSQAR